MRRWLRIAVPLGIATVLVTVLAIGMQSPSGLAAPGGKGHGKANGHGNGGSSAADMWVEGNPFAAWGEEDYVVHGTGFHPDEPVYLSMATPGCCAGDITVADGDGNFTMTRATGAPGTYEIKASQFSGKGKLTIMASVSFLVTEQ
jgi:hypothetical protein